MMKKYFNTAKYSRATLFFQGKRKLLKNLNNKKYIFSTVNSGHPLFFRASASCSKILNAKSIFNINTVKNSRATLFFRARASCSKLLDDKIYFNAVKNSRTTLFFSVRASCSKVLNLKRIFHTVKIFRASASCSKHLNVKSIFNPVKHFWATVFQGKRELLRNLECKKYIEYQYSEKF